MPCRRSSGEVVSVGTSLRAGQFCKVVPTTVARGRDRKGVAASFARQPRGGYRASAPVLVYLLGSFVPATGDYLVCRFVDHRWVAETTGGGTSHGTGVMLPSCFCLGPADLDDDLGRPDLQLRDVPVLHARLWAPPPASWRSGIHANDLHQHQLFVDPITGLELLLLLLLPVQPVLPVADLPESPLGDAAIATGSCIAGSSAGTGTSVAPFYSNYGMPSRGATRHARSPSPGVDPGAGEAPTSPRPPPRQRSAPGGGGRPRSSGSRWRATTPASCRGSRRPGAGPVGFVLPLPRAGGAEAWQLALTQPSTRKRSSGGGRSSPRGGAAVAPAMLGELASRMPVGFGLQAARTLARETDVIISWSVLDHDALFRGIDAAPRVALACHFPGEMPWTAAAEALLAQVDRLVAVSELAVESLPEALRGRAEVIWNAVDADAAPGDRRPGALERPGVCRPGPGWPATSGGWLPRRTPTRCSGSPRRCRPRGMSYSSATGGKGGRWPSEVARLGLRPGPVRARDDRSGRRPRRVRRPGGPVAVRVVRPDDGRRVLGGVPVVATRSGLAKLVPGLVREVGFVPSGAELARAILLDHDTRPPGDGPGRPGPAVCLRSPRPGRFGRDWTDLVRDLAPRPAERGETMPPDPCWPDRPCARFDQACPTARVAARPIPRPATTGTG